MVYLFIFILGGLAAFLCAWVWEAMIGRSPTLAARAMVEYQAAQENQRLLDEFVAGELPELSRSEIWEKMGWFWKEPRGWVARSGGALSWICLSVFAALYAYLWFKTLLSPNSHDLRLLLGGRSLIMYVTQERTS